MIWINQLRCRQRSPASLTLIVRSNLMTPKSMAIGGFMLTSFAAGAVYVTAARAGEGAAITLQFASTVVSLAMVFIWLRYDEPQVNYRRSAWFNIGVVALAFIFVPLYLSRSRPPGSRLSAVLASLGLMALSYGLTLAGYYLGRAMT